MEYLSSVYLWKTNTCCRRISQCRNKRRLTASLGQTLCTNSVLQKTEKQNPGGCKCTTLNLPAGALGRCMSNLIMHLCVFREVTCSFTRTHTRTNAHTHTHTHAHTHTHTHTHAYTNAQTHIGLHKHARTKCFTINRSQ